MTPDDFAAYEQRVRAALARCTCDSAWPNDTCKACSAVVARYLQAASEVAPARAEPTACERPVNRASQVTTRQVTTALDAELVRLACECWPHATIEVELDDETLSVFDVLPNRDVRQTLLLLQRTPHGDAKVAACLAMVALSSI